MTDWPLLLFLVIGGALILLIGLLEISDLDSFFAALAMIIDAAVALPESLYDMVSGLIEDVQGGDESPGMIIEEEETMMEEIK